MVTCSSCQTKNTLDSRFCRGCGVALDADAVAARRAEAAAVVAEGQQLFGAGRVEEARTLANQVVSDDPENVAGLALLGDCLERDGFVAEALECYEHVVLLNPDSALDRIRLVQLRKKASSPAAAPAAGDRRFALAASIAAAVLLMSAGSAVVMATRPAPKSAQVAQSGDSADIQAFSGASPVPRPSGLATPEGQPAEEAMPQPSAAVAGRGASTGASGLVRRDSRPVGTPASQNPTGRPARPESGSYRPVNPFSVTPETLPSTTPSVASASPDEPKPVVDDGRTKPEGRRAVVDVRPSQGSGRTVGGSTTVERDQANEAETLLRVGRQHQVSGDHRQAAAAYERALARGADAATTNQRLAQAYEKQGRKAEAAGAYRKAAAAFEQKLKDGKGDRKLIESQIEGCNQAAKLLGG
jgi:tetratricopeptide (TPR) repeat protein